MGELGMGNPDAFGKAGEVGVRSNLGIGHGIMAATSAENLPARQKEGER